MSEQFRLPTDRLYFEVKAKSLPFATTKDIKPRVKVFGHDLAKDALTFAIGCPAKGFNAYVRGLSGIGRKTLVKQVLNENKPNIRRKNDYCYVHNFSHPNVPRLIILQGGYGKQLKQMLSSFCDYVINDLPKTLNSAPIRAKRKTVEEKANKSVVSLYQPFEKILEKRNLVLANFRENEETRMVIAPTYEGKALSPDEANQMIKAGTLSKEYIKVLNEELPALQLQLSEIVVKSNDIMEQNFVAIRTLENDFARGELSEYLDAISKKFTNDNLDEYLDEIIDDFIENILHNQTDKFDPTVFYGVNILNDPYKTDKAPVFFEYAPTLSNLLGSVETEGQLPPYQSIIAGSLIKANGGFLIVEVDEALSAGTWAVLMRILRTGKLSFTFEDKPDGRPTMIKPESLPLDVKVILIGSYQRFYELSAYDSDFLDNFKVLVDLDSELSRHEESYLQYAQVICKVVNEEKLCHFDCEAVAQLIEYGIRLSGSKNKLSSRFGHIIDRAREADYLAKKAGEDLVGRAHVIDAIDASKRRSFAPAKRFYDVLDNGTIIVETMGERVGQINGLAVSHAGTTSYGFPARITGTIAPGKAGLINIEGQADLSGQIHTKGFQILGGLLRYILKPNHPLSFAASIAFEQSYGGIDGDSASGAEACCLLSALVGVPIKQSLSMTGAIDQFGQLQAIGGVNEKIEGFYDTCQLKGLNGCQGVIIPVANIDNLMLRDDIVYACNEKKFHLYAVDHVLDALAILTGTESCKYELVHDLPYQPQSLLANAIEATRTLFQQSKS
ncbi:MAG: AAA family ATPase [Ostreibacterium sp.]